MDLSPKLLTDVQFREQWRGYNPDEVDDFLERVAVGVEELQRRLTDALERAAAAEHRLVERSDEDEIRRTLVLAQRTADASVEEAKAEADRLVRDAQQRAKELLADADSRAAELDAEIAERRRTELGDLASERAALQADVDALRAFVDAERERLAALLQSHLEEVRRELSVREAPTLSAVATPAPPPPEAPVEMRVPETVDAPPLEDEVPETATDDEAESVGEASGEEEVAEAGRPSLFDDAADEPSPEPPWRAAQPATAAVDLAELEAHALEDDPFLAELRRAVSDTEPLGPRDHELPGSMHHHDEDDDRSGFFRRGRRRG